MYEKEKEKSKEELREGGYDYARNKSNRGVLANKEGKYCLSDIAKITNLPTAYIAERFKPIEWHHSGSKKLSVRKVDYYSVAKVRAFVKKNPDDLKTWKANKPRFQNYYLISVRSYYQDGRKFVAEWDEYRNVKIKKKGVTLTIKLKSGEIIKKRESSVELRFKTKREYDKVERYHAKALKEAKAKHKKRAEFNKKKLKLYNFMVGEDLEKTISPHFSGSCYGALRSKRIVDFVGCKSQISYIQNFLKKIKGKRFKIVQIRMVREQAYRAITDHKLRDLTTLKDITGLEAIKHSELTNFCKKHVEEKLTHPKRYFFIK